MRLARSLSVLISTFFGIGYLPLMPGTFGSLAGIAVICLLGTNQMLYGISTVVFIALGFICAGRAEDAFGKKDCRYIVIDEVSGMFVSLLFLPHTAKVMAIAFVLFRILDTMKPFPAGPLQKVKGSGGIMGDDLIAGVYANVLLQIALRLTSFIGA